jgi:hypothetical protein
MVNDLDIIAECLRERGVKCDLTISGGIQIFGTHAVFLCDSIVKICMNRWSNNCQIDLCNPDSLDRLAKILTHCMGGGSKQPPHDYTWHCAKCRTI